MPGVTRKSLLELAAYKGYIVEETDCPVDEAMEADEIFTAGTAVVVQSVGSLTFKVGEWAGTAFWSAQQSRRASCRTTYMAYHPVLYPHDGNMCTLIALKGLNMQLLLVSEPWSTYIAASCFPPCIIPLLPFPTFQ